MQVEWVPEERDGLARTGTWYFNGYKISTPTLLVVVDPDPRKQLVPINEIRKLGIEIIMTSSYIAKRKIGKGNLKDVLGWDSVLYTDSGTYQAYSRGAAVDPVESVRYQAEAGVDIVTPVDEFSLPTDDYETALSKALTSFKRWLQAKELTSKLVTSPVQGGKYPSIRGKVTKMYMEHGAKLLAVGGIVPLMVNYDFVGLVDAIAPVVAARDPTVPVHAFGAGHPLSFPLLVLMGVDMFDSAMYVLAAKDGRYLTRWGTLSVEELVKLREFPCSCPICSSMTPKDLEGMTKTEIQRFLALHNLYVAWEMVLELRRRIEEKSFYKWALAFAHVHPRLYEGVYHLHDKWRGLMKRAMNFGPPVPTPNASTPLFSLSVNKDLNARDLSDLFIKSIKKGYGVEVDCKNLVYNNGLVNCDNLRGALKASHVFPCLDTLLSLGFKVRTKKISKIIRKSDLMDDPQFRFLVNSPVAIVDEDGEMALGIFLVSLEEYVLMKDGVVIRSLAPSLDQVAPPCTQDRSRKRQR